MPTNRLARAWQVARWALVLAIVAFWFVALRPQAVGGPAGFALVSGTSMLPVMHNGDLVIVHHRDGYRIGDVIAYRVPKGDPAAGAQIIHRIVGGDARTGFVVQGDNRTAADIWRPKPHDIVGRAWVHVPHAGRVVSFAHTPLFLGALAATMAIMWVLYSGLDETRRDDD
jgi:signal peptidase I